MNNNISNSSEHDYIRRIQRYLRELSFYDKDIPSVPIDGIYEGETRRSVLEFQRKHALEPTGRVNRETFDRLYDVYRESRGKNGAAVRLAVFPNNQRGFIVRPGDSLFIVYIIQYILRELAVEYDFPAPVEITGSYDKSTEGAVKYFQSRVRLEQTGVVDRATWNSLAELFDAAQNEYYQ